MISILDLDHQHSVELADKLKSITNQFNITLTEYELMKSDKIIISFSGSIQKAIKKIHLMNLFSALRMISDKPVLGINSGMYLMCESVGEIACLGIIPEAITKTENQIIKETNSNFTEIIKIENDPLLNNIENICDFYFEDFLLIPKTQFTTSVFRNNPEISASVRKNNFFGVQFFPQKSGENGLKVLRNFVEL